MHRSAGNINHVTGVHVEPVQQFLGALLLDRFFQLSNTHARFQSQGNLRSIFRVRYIPTFSLAPWLMYTARLFVVGMNLYRKFLMRKKKLQQQGETPSVAGCIADQIPLVSLADLRQRLSAERTVRHIALVASEPGLADLFLTRTV